MNFQQALIQEVNTLFQSERGDQDLASKVSMGPTRKEFEGDFTLVVFPFTSLSKKSPEDTANFIGAHLQNALKDIESFNVIKGFLNLKMSDAYWKQQLQDLLAVKDFNLSANGERVLVEFSSPNTNKPLHLGHIRNILLGASTSNLLKAAGNEIVNTQRVNDRGIAVCKSMLAWKMFGEDATPESTGKKGDHFVGDFYVLFETKFKAEYANWQNQESGKSAFQNNKKEGETEEQFFKRYKNNYFNEGSELGAKAKKMLQAWEANDEEIRALWKQMNQWVYSGFDETYERLGAEFDLLYFESDTYLLGKDIIEQGLKDGQFYTKEDGSVWIDLEDVGLDHKLVLRSDGTSVYMTQDLGTAEVRYKNHQTKKMIYTVGNEQDYHFKALFEICKKMERPYADGLYHLSYGMVDLPSGKMKSREGTVVDADDLIDEVINEAKINAQEREVQLEVSEAEQNEIYRKIGLGALKYFILKVNPKKRIIFDPKESVDMQGDTGPYIQNAFVRIKSILRRLESELSDDWMQYEELEAIEKDILQQLGTYSAVIKEGAQNFDPSAIASFSYQLARSFHRFYHDVSILKAETPAAKSFRVLLSKQVARVLEHAFGILGIEMPEKM